MRLALIGKGNGKELAPLKGKGIVTWGVNDIVGHRDVDVCFFMDRHIMRDTLMEELIIKSVAKTETPVYCIEHYDDIPSSIPYPKDEIFETFGTDYFSDSFCYMLALAIYQGYKEFNIYGFNYAFGEKYIYEKPSCQMWLGIALGRGVVINVHGEWSELFQTHDGKVYSYLTPQTMPRTGIRVRDFKLPAGEYNFSVNDRVILMGLMPKVGDYATMKLAQKLHKNLSFTLEENKKLNFRQVENKEGDNKPYMIWDDNDLPNKTIEFTEAEAAMIRSWFYGLEQHGGITFNNLILYEKFCK